MVPLKVWYRTWTAQLNTMAVLKGGIFLNVFLFCNFIYFVYTGLRCCTGFPLVAETLVAVRRLLIAVAFLEEHRLWGVQAQ